MEKIKYEIPIGIQWKITKQEIQAAFSQNQELTSKQFEPKELPAIDYYLVLDKGSDDQISFELAISMTQPPIIVDAEFHITIVSANYSFKGKRTYNNSWSWGKKFSSFTDFFDPANNYFIDDILFITLEGILSFEKEQQVFDNYAVKSFQNLGEVLWNRDDKDFDIEVEGKYVKAHKNVISAKSLVFERMIQSGLKESIESKVKITDFDFEVVEIAMKFCYGIEITQFINVSRGIKLLQFSDKYDDSIEKYLFNQKSPMNIVEIIDASVLSNSIKLREQCFVYMVDQMKKSIFIKDLDNLDTEFAKRLLKASFSCV